MRYQPERALTLDLSHFKTQGVSAVEMRYQPERALTPIALTDIHLNTAHGVEMRYQPESKALVLVISKMIKEWCKRQVPRKALGDSHLKNAHIGACPRQK